MAGRTSRILLQSHSENPIWLMKSPTWLRADEDSFQIQTPEGQEHTIRLYGADCIEWHVSDDSDARRLRAQRRYFGI
jgi:hypothetical protein